MSFAKWLLRLKIEPIDEPQKTTTLQGMDAWWGLYMSHVFKQYIRWTFSLEFNPSTHKCDEMTAWNPSKFDTTIWQCHKSVVMSCYRSAPYHAAVQQALNPLLWSLVVWPRFHAQLTPTQKRSNISMFKRVKCQTLTVPVKPSSPSFSFAAKLHVRWPQPWRKDRKGLWGLWFLRVE